MGGREFAALLDGAPPGAASLEALQGLLQSNTFAFPSFARQGGPFAHRSGYLERNGERLHGACATHLDAAARATLAACYCAQLTSWLVDFLWSHQRAAAARVIVEGPLAGNPVYMRVLQALLPERLCLASSDAVEGTARGAWMLTRWQAGATQGGILQPVPQHEPLPGMAAYHARWRRQVDAPD
jgi:hypothetical protein